MLNQNLSHDRGSANLNGNNSIWGSALQNPAGISNIDIQLKVHPRQSGIIIIQYPGLNADVDGYNLKYETMGNFMRDKLNVAVVRSSNYAEDADTYPHDVCENLRTIVNYSLNNSLKICGHSSPDLYLVGISAGASAIAAVCSEYQSIKKILLVVPSSNADKQRMNEGLSRYRGDVFVLAAELDTVVKAWPSDVYALAKSARHKDYRLVEGCDHQFRGEHMGRILSSAPLWAFGELAAPGPEHGIKLYD